RRHLVPDGRPGQDPCAPEPEELVDLAPHRAEGEDPVRRLALLAALGLLLAGPAQASGPPPEHASAWLIENAATGEVLASSEAHERLPIASITKLMTVLVTLDHESLKDVVTVDPRAAAVGESSAGLEPGDRLTVAEL